MRLSSLLLLPIMLSVGIAAGVNMNAEEDSPSRELRSSKRSSRWSPRSRRSPRRSKKRSPPITGGTGGPFTCNGVQKGLTCCSDGCGECGGAGCGNRGYGLDKNDCCTSEIDQLCSNTGSAPCIMDDDDVDDIADGVVPEWTYRDTQTGVGEPYGPSNWHLGYPNCGLTSQSPINLAADLSEVKTSSDYSLEFIQNVCESSDLTFTANYAVWKVYFDECETTPYLKWQGDVYNLLQVHIHSPSEHLMGGAESAADIHMVHVKEGTTDQLLVVGVMFDVSKYGNNVEVQKLWDILGLGETKTTETFTTAIYEILPPSPSFSHYMGSLTTPPCTEGVTWIVMNEPSSLGIRQLEEYRRAVAMYPDSKVGESGNTNRPAQELNGRTLVYVTP